MLCELQELSGSLHTCGIIPPAAHPWVQPLEKGDFLIASLDTACGVQEVEFRGSAEGAGICKVKKDNHNSFPATKLNSPIFSVAADHPLRAELARTELSGGDRASMLDSLCAGAPFSDSAAERKRLKVRLQEFARELHPLFLERPPEGPAVSLLLDRLTAVELNPDEFLKQIARCAIAAVARGEDWKFGEQLLIGAVKPKSRGIEEKKITLVLDVARAPEDDFARVAHPKMEALYHRVLLAQERGAADGICALTGLPRQLEHGTLPSPKLPELENTILLSMNPDTPCNDRYGRSGADIFPVGKDAARDLYDAVLWITAAARQRKTWAPVPRNDGPRNDLLIAYLDLLPELPAEIAGVLADATDVRLRGEFESEAERVIAALDARGTIPRDAIFHTLVLRRISKGQVQVELNRHYRVERLRRAVFEWRAAASNVPEFEIYGPKGKGQPASRLAPWTPYPGEVVRATKSYWIRNGEEHQSAIGCDLSTVYDLFLGEGAVSGAAAGIVLSSVINRCFALLLRCGEQLHRHGPIVRDLAVSARQPAVLAITILGITLHKLGRHKERYMSEPAFLLGRMLAFADVLHAQYCTVVRGDDLPPQLLGNQHFAMASDRPGRALAVLSQRLTVYKAWADTAKIKPESPESAQRGIRIAKWALARMGEVTSQLEGRVPVGSFVDREKAEMLLGYLSRETKDITKDEGAENNG
jgi:hypothetical protein